VEGLEVPKQIRELATAVIKCALERRESRDAHYRIDYPTNE